MNLCIKCKDEINSAWGFDHYFPALKVKWFTISWMSSISFAIFLNFYLLPALSFPISIVEKVTNSSFVFIIGVILFHSWFHARSGTFWERQLTKILNFSYERSRTSLTPQSAFFDAWLLNVLLIFMVVIALCGWQFPEYKDFCSWGVGLCGASLGNYVYNEEVKASNRTKMKWSFAFSTSTFVIAILLVHFLSLKGISYGEIHHTESLYITTVGQWFSFGFLGALFVAWLSRYRNKFVQE